MALTPRRRRFVDEYLIDLDARAAARRAGFAPRTKSYVTRLMRDPDVARLIAEAMAARARRTGITRERVLEEYARIAFVDLAALADWGGGKGAIRDAALLSDEAAAAIVMVREARSAADAGRLRIKTFDKMKALEALARLLDPLRNADGRYAPTPLPNRAH
jgi:phage terminase small subunit